MLGRKTYTPEEIDVAEAAIAAQLEAYASIAADAPADFEPLLTRHLVLALDRPFVHRVRSVGGKDANPLNEVELLVESIMAGDGVLHATTVFKWIPENTVLGLAIGDPIALDIERFTRLSAAFFAELRARCL